MNAAHLGDDAEVYALGALDPIERATVEGHVAECDDCAARLSEAESVAAMLASALPQEEPPRRLETRLLGGARGNTVRPRFFSWALPVALAAAFAIVLGWQQAVMHAERQRTTVALSTIVHSHFLHVMMNKTRPDAPNAKVLYARDGAWLYVIADRPAANVHVVLIEDGAERDAGVLQPQGAVSALYVPSAGRPSAVRLRDGAGLVSSAMLRY